MANHLADPHCPPHVLLFVILLSLLIRFGLLSFSLNEVCLNNAFEFHHAIVNKCIQIFLLIMCLSRQNCIPPKFLSCQSTKLGIGPGEWSLKLFVFNNLVVIFSMLCYHQRLEYIVVQQQNFLMGSSCSSSLLLSSFVMSLHCLFYQIQALHFCVVPQFFSLFYLPVAINQLYVFFHFRCILVFITFQNLIALLLGLVRLKLT